MAIAIANLAVELRLKSQERQVRSRPLDLCRARARRLDSLLIGLWRHVPRYVTPKHVKLQYRSH